MAIYRLLKNSTFDSSEVSRMTAAYEVALTELGITDRADPRGEIIAWEIIQRASTGELEARELADFAIKKMTGKVATEVARTVPMAPDFASQIYPHENPD